MKGTALKLPYEPRDESLRDAITAYEGVTTVFVSVHDENRYITPFSAATPTAPNRSYTSHPSLLLLFDAGDEVRHLEAELAARELPFDLTEGEGEVVEALLDAFSLLRVRPEPVQLSFGRHVPQLVHRLVHPMPVRVSYREHDQVFGRIMGLAALSDHGLRVQRLRVDLVAVVDKGDNAGVGRHHHLYVGGLVRNPLGVSDEIMDEVVRFVGFVARGGLVRAAEAALQTYGRMKWGRVEADVPAVERATQRVACIGGFGGRVRIAGGEEIGMLSWIPLPQLELGLPVHCSFSIA
ncbi:hypothetical protein EDB85DRAFT_1898789, partial [Lactarius pseudohatsudake]